MKTKIINIKKYENRRLYNVSEKKYISLEDVKKIILSGYDIKVTEKKSGKDITKQVLFQVIMDMSPEKLNAFPVMFLKFLIKSDAPMLNDYFENFFSNQIGLYMKNREAYLNALKGMQGKMFGQNMFENPFTKMFGNSYDKSENIDEDIPEDEQDPIDEPNDSSDDEIDELKKMMQKMAEKISNLEKK